MDLLRDPQRRKKRPPVHPEMGQRVLTAAEQNRTVDTWIFSPLLYQLSYSGSHSNGPILVHAFGELYNTYPEKSQYRSIRCCVAPTFKSFD